MADANLNSDISEQNGDDSESSVENSEGEEVPVKKKTQTWNFECVLKTTDEMDAYFYENGYWKRSFINNTKDYSKTYYYCHINGRVLVNKCPAQLCVLKKSSTTNFIIHRANEHNHVENKPSKQVSPDIVDKIKEFHEQGFTQRLISDKLRQDKNILSAPTKQQVCKLR